MAGCPVHLIRRAHQRLGSLVPLPAADTLHSGAHQLGTTPPCATPARRASPCRDPQIKPRSSSPYMWPMMGEPIYLQVLRLKSFGHGGVWRQGEGLGTSGRSLVALGRRDIQSWPPRAPGWSQPQNPPSDRPAQSFCRSTSGCE